MGKLVECTDHTGNKFKTVQKMCEYWKISRDTFEKRIKYGWTLEDALTVKVKTRDKVSDHTGMIFTSIREMCKHWGVKERLFQSRINYGWSVKDALEVNIKSNETVDHLGNRFKTCGEMCQHWGIKHVTYIRRLKNGWSVEKALTTPLLKSDLIKDESGNVLGTIASLAKEFGVNHSTLSYRLRQSKEFNRQELSKKAKEAPQINVFGTSYKRLADVERAFNIGKSTIRYRVGIGIELEVALILPVSKGRGNIIRKKLDSTNIMTYKLPGSNEWLTTMEVISKYRPDLLNIYCMENPTGEYRAFDGWKCIENNVKKHKDHRGNSFESIELMCEYWGVHKTTFLGRIRHGWKLEDALETNVNSFILEKKKIVIFGKQYDNLETLASSFGITSALLRGRLRLNIEIEAALVLGEQNTYRFLSKYIGLDNKIYYKVNNNNKWITTRDIIEECRPDLVEAYDLENPTGEYKPYTKRV